MFQGATFPESQTKSFRSTEQPKLLKSGVKITGMEIGELDTGGIISFLAIGHLLPSS